MGGEKEKGKDKMPELDLKEVIEILDNFLSDTNFPGKSPRARQALSLAISKLKLLQEVEKGRVRKEGILNNLSTLNLITFSQTMQPKDLIQFLITRLTK